MALLRISGTQACKAMSWAWFLSFYEVRWLLFITTASPAEVMLAWKMKYWEYIFSLLKIMSQSHANAAKFLLHASFSHDAYLLDIYGRSYIGAELMPATPLPLSMPQILLMQKMISFGGIERWAGCHASRHIASFSPPLSCQPLWKLSAPPSRIPAHGFWIFHIDKIC